MRLYMCVLPLQAITQDRTGHKDPVRGALYNAAFAVIVSVDEAGTTCVWNLQVRHSFQDCLTQQDAVRGAAFVMEYKQAAALIPRVHWLAAVHAPQRQLAEGPPWLALYHTPPLPVC